MYSDIKFDAESKFGIHSVRSSTVTTSYHKPRFDVENRLRESQEYLGGMIIAFFKYCYFWKDIFGVLTQTLEAAPQYVQLWSAPPPLDCN